MPKDWDDMTADDKADRLRKQIERMANQINAGFSRIQHRVSAIEADLKKQPADS